MKAKNLVEMVAQTVQRYGSKDAFMWKHNGAYQGITYHAFWEKVRQVAAGLMYLGIKANDKVAILSENNPNWPVSDLAIMSLGAVSVPIHSTLPQDQITYILKNADCTFVFVQDEEHLKKINIDSIPTAIYYPPQPFMESDKLFSMEHLTYLGVRHPNDDWETNWAELTREDLATIIHTSGTTGMPKGAMLSHGNILANVEAVQFWVMEVRSSDILLSHLPLSHVFERMAGQFMPLSVGAAVAYAEGIRKVPENLKEVQPTVLVSVPLLFEKIYGEAQKMVESGSTIRKKIFHWAIDIGLKRYQYYLSHTVDEILSLGIVPREIERKWKLANKLVYSKVKQQLGGRVRGLISGGGALNPEIAKFFWAIDVPVLEGYGLTETAPVISANPIMRSKAGSVGRPLPNLEIQIAPDGEVMVKGPSVMMGYYKNEEATAAQFQNGWLLTGDIGSIDEDGYLKIVDRKKRIIVLKTGKNVAPQPVENAITQSGYIQNAVLIGQDQKYVIVLITPNIENLLSWAENRGLKGSIEELIQIPDVQKLLTNEVEAFTKKFARYEQPKKVVIIGKEWTVEEGELTPSLKVRLPEIKSKYKEIIEQAYVEDIFMDLKLAQHEVAVGISLSRVK